MLQWDGVSTWADSVEGGWREHPHSTQPVLHLIWLTQHVAPTDVAPGVLEVGQP